MKSFVLALLFISGSAFAAEKKVQLGNGINIVKVTLTQEMPGCGHDGTKLSVIKLPAKAGVENTYLIGDNRDLDKEQLQLKLNDFTLEKTCPSFYKVSQTVQFLAFGGDQITIVYSFPWKISGEPEVTALK